MNNPAQGMRINCPNCGTPFNARVDSIIDAGRDPAAKARFLGGQVNQAQCPNCNVVVQLSAPIAYHDHTKELLLILFPQQVNIPTEERERIIGEMTRAIMNTLPQDQRKGYLFNPITPLTLQGMMEMVLEKDGITKEMIEAQQQKMDLIETFMRAPANELENLVQQHDAQMDQEFFQLLTLSAEAALGAGRQDAARGILARRDALLALSSYGQEALANAEQQEAVVMEVAQWLEGQGNQLEAEALLDYIEQHGDSDDHLQAIVGLLRPAMGYPFYQALDERIDSVGEDRAARLRSARDRLLELSTALDQQQQAMVQQAQGLLSDLLQAADLEQAILERLPMLDNLFIQVLAANLQDAEQRGDLLSSARLKNLYEKVVEAMQAAAPPEVRFINELLSTEDPLDAKLTLTERAAEFGPSLIDYMDAILNNLAQQGDSAAPLMEQLSELREAAISIIRETSSARD